MADERNTPFNQVFPNLIQLTAEGLLETGDGRPDPQQMLDEKASLSPTGGVLYPRGVIEGSDSDRTLNWQSTHFTNATLSSVGDGIDLLDLVIASEASITQHRAGFAGVAELTFAARRDGGVQSVWHRTIPFAVNFRAGGPRVSSGNGISAEDSNSTGVATNFTLAITGRTATTGTLRIELSSIPGTDITNSTLAVTIRGLATWDDPSRAITIERA